MRAAVRLEVELYTYDWWVEEKGTEGHSEGIPDIPVALTVDGIVFRIEDDTFPIGQSLEEIKRVQRAVEHLTNTVAQAAVFGGDFCAEARAEGRGPCGACSWCVQQAQDRAEKAERELAKIQVKGLIHDVAVRLFKAGVISRDEGAILTRLSLSEFADLLVAYGVSPIQEDE